MSKLPATIVATFLFLLCQGVTLSVTSFLARSSLKNSNFKNDEIMLQGITVLEAPFVYSESGPYRGYCVDVIKEISSQVGFNYSLKQSPDGQIGSADLMNGVFGELSRDFAEFAIGDISRTWFNDERKALNAGVVYTRPILTSTMSILVSKNLLQELFNNKTEQCIEILNSGNPQRKNRSFNKRNGDNLSPLERRTNGCAKRVNLDDIFQLTNLNRLIIQGSAVHEYFSRNVPHRLSDLILVDKSSLFGYGLEKLQNSHYVLVDESKFTEYFVDQNCHFDYIDASGKFKDEMANVKIDESIFGEAKLKSKFRNEIVIALSSSLVQQHKKMWKRDWLADFNRAIDRLEDSGKLRELQDKHWRNNCRQNGFTNSQMSLKASLFPVASMVLAIAIIINIINL